MYAGDLHHPTYVYATCMADELIAHSHGWPIRTVATTVWCTVASQWEEGRLWHWTGLLASSRVIMNLSVRVSVYEKSEGVRGNIYTGVLLSYSSEPTNTIIWLNWGYMYIIAIQVSVPTACFECWSWEIGWKGILKRRVWWISFPPPFLMIRSLHALLLSWLVCHHGAVSPVTVHGLVHFH